MTFTQYVEMNLNKALNNQENVITNIVPSEETQKGPGIVDCVKSCVASKWYARIIEDEKYLIFNEKYLNISQLAKTLKDLYRTKGYEGYGYSKLNESELVRYKTIKDIIIKEFTNDYNDDELDVENIANLIFNKDFTNIEWHPEELTM